MVCGVVVVLVVLASVVGSTSAVVVVVVVVGVVVSGSEASSDEEQPITRQRVARTVTGRRDRIVSVWSSGGGPVVGSSPHSQPPLIASADEDDMAITENYQ